MKKKLLFFLFCTLAPVLFAQYTSVNEKFARDIFRELIEINTTSRFGSTKAAEAMAVRLRSAGFQSSDIQVIGPDQQHKNLVFRYHGNGKQKPILFICHLDVVEALSADWSVDPFTFLEKDGFFYGRGTTDIKNEDASLIANIIRLKTEGFVPNRDIIIALTADEENGTANGVDWLLKNHRDMIDSEFCINPDGGGGDSRNGKNITIAIQTSEKIYVSYRLEVKNKGGHSSLPVKDNAIYTLSSGLIRLSEYDFPIRLNETTHNFFEKVAVGESEKVKSDINGIFRTPPDTASARRLANYSAFYNAMMRTTCVVTMMNAGHAENALPQTAQAVVNCRMLPDENPDIVLNTLKNVLHDQRISVTTINLPNGAPLSPLRDDVTRTVTDIVSNMWPGVTVVPIMSTGATDGRYLRLAGIPVYGVSGMFGDVDDVRAHGKDERISAKDFYEGVEFMYRFIKDLSSEK
jgi:acetylornithine deacetylase/succinyl-diaminopimelate desuccinylase-like protein